MGLDPQPRCATRRSGTASTSCAIDQGFEATRSFRPKDEQQVATILARSAGAAQADEYELFKTTAHFDETARNAEWPGQDSARVRQLTPTTAG